MHLLGFGSCSHCRTAPIIMAAGPHREAVARRPVQPSFFFILKAGRLFVLVAFAIRAGLEPWPCPRLLFLLDVPRVAYCGFRFVRFRFPPGRRPLRKRRTREKEKPKACRCLIEPFGMSRTIF